MSTVALTKPIQAHGETRSQLELREPNGGDVAACGFPFSFSINDDGSQTITPNAQAIAALISRLAEIPRGSVNQLSFADWMTSMSEVLNFFGASVPTTQTTSSEDTSSSPGSGNNGRAQRSR